MPRPPRIDGRPAHGAEAAQAGTQEWTSLQAPRPVLDHRPVMETGRLPHFRFGEVMKAAYEAFAASDARGRDVRLPAERAATMMPAQAMYPGVDRQL